MHCKFTEHSNFSFQPDEDWTKIYSITSSSYLFGLFKDYRIFQMLELLTFVIIITVLIQTNSTELTVLFMFICFELGVSVYLYD